MPRSIGRLISILYRKNQVYMNIALKKYGITSAEQPFLTSLYIRNGATQDDISSHLNIDKAATTRVIQSLMEKGYVTKEKDPNDKRCNRIYTTSKADDIKLEIIQQLWNWNDFLTEDMDEDSKDFVYSALENMVLKVESTDFKKKWRDK